MYPYRTRKKATESTPAEKNALSTDRRLKELLLLARQDAAAMEQKYTALQQKEALQNGKDTLQAMVTDTKKHQRILRELLFTLFSDSFTEVLEEIAEADSKTESAAQLLEELLFQEMDDISFYRSLMAALAAEALEEDLWYLLFEIITDKQNHTTALNHLYAKYLQETSGN